MIRLGPAVTPHLGTGEGGNHTGPAKAEVFGWANDGQSILYSLNNRSHQVADQRHALWCICIEVVTRSAKGLSSDTKVDPPNDTNIDPLGM